MTMNLSEKKKSAKAISVIVFIFMVSVSTVIFISEDTLSAFDYFLIISAPFVLGVFFYFIVLHHDPDASD